MFLSGSFLSVPEGGRILSNGALGVSSSRNDPSVYLRVSCSCSWIILIFVIYCLLLKLLKCDQDTSQSLSEKDEADFYLLYWKVIIIECGESEFPKD